MLRQLAWRVFLIGGAFAVLGVEFRNHIWLLLAGLLVLVATACGQELLPFTVEPLSAWLQLPSGAEYSGSFLIKNVGQNEVILNILPVDFIYTENGEPVTLEPGTLGSNSLCPYITYSPTQMTLRSGEVGEVSYTVSLPPDVNDPCWAMLAVTPEAPQEIELESPEEGFRFVVRMSLKYLFTIVQQPPSSVQPAGQVVKMNAKGSTEEDGSRKVTVTLTFQNLVDDVLRCKVYFEVRDAFGDKLARYDMPYEMIVLPHATRNFVHTFEGLDWRPGEYLILGVVDFGGDYLAAGQYLATVRE